MYLIRLFCLSVALMPLFGLGQIQVPAQNARLNYLHIPFQWDSLATDEFELEIAEDVDFGKVVFRQKTTRARLVVREKLAFGKTYFWRAKPSKFVHRFFTQSCSKVNPDLWRHQIVQNRTSIRDNWLICVDKPGVIIDLKGRPVWFHPDTTIKRFFDLRILPNGHIAYLRARGQKEGNENLLFEEITPDGQLIWQGPNRGEVSGLDSERYHHAYQILPNGHYLLAGDEFVKKELPNGKGPVLARLGTLLEYDQQGDLVWSWKSSEHLSEQRIFSNRQDNNPIHLNGFHQAPGQPHIYASFRYLNEVFVIDKKDGKIIETEKGPFQAQHSPTVEGKTLWLYDNRSGKDGDTISSVLALNLETDSSTRFQLDFGDRRNSWSKSKGDVDILGKVQLLACMGSVPRTVLIDQGKGIIWEALHQFREHPDQPWAGVIANYRAHASRSLFPEEEGIPIPPTFRVEVVENGRKGSFRITHLGGSPSPMVYQIGDGQEIFLEGRTVGLKKDWSADVPFKIKGKQWKQAQQVELVITPRYFPQQAFWYPLRD
ncbi:MAG: arylsulfotransferase family protein [Bacteroidota bacterium]